MKTSIILAAFLVSFISAVSCQIDTPRGTLDEFNNALKEKNSEALIAFLVNEPNYVDDKAMVEHRRIYKLPEPQPVPEKTEGTDGSFYRDGHARQLEGVDLVRSVVPVDLLFEQIRTITKILSVRESGNEALAKVEMAGSRSKNGEKYSPLIYDILLYKEKAGWKIFKMNGPSGDDEKYYQYNFYANPNFKP